MGVALGCRDPRMAKHLLNDADVLLAISLWAIGDQSDVAGPQVIWGALQVLGLYHGVRPQQLVDGQVGGDEGQAVGQG